MTTRWRVARSLTTLMAEVNAAYPNRPKGADGTVGDAAHQAEVSDHDPNAHGVVTAWDITTAPFCDALADKLRSMGAKGDGRVKYVIFKNRFTSAKHGWRWVNYQTVRPGGDPHTGHIHLSVSADPAQYDRTDHWHVFDLTSNAISNPTPIGDDDMTPEQDARLKNIEQMLTALIAPRRQDHADTDPQHISLGDVITADENK